MAGAFTLDDPGVTLTQPATPIAVFKFDPSSTSDESRFRLLPNVMVDHIERPIGPQPSTARFHYLLDNSGIYPDWPSQYEDIWPQTARSSQYVVVTDDRIAVIAWTPSGERRMLFDGFAQIPQVNLDSGRQTISFVASGCEIRCWDVTIGGRTQRDGDDPNGGAEVRTDLPVRFNPSDGKGGILSNCTPDLHDVNEDDSKISYPVFLEDHLEYRAGNLTTWTVNKAVRYILSVHNDGAYVKNPSMAMIEDDLLVKVPTAGEGNGTIDPGDPSTYTAKHLTLRDYDASNKPWPEVIEDLLGMIGYGFYFSTPTDTGDNSPTTEIYVFRFDEDQTTPKTLLHDAYGSTIDPTRNDVAQLALARDVNHVVNSFGVETPNRELEVSIVLASGYTPTVGDETAAGGNRNKFLSSKLGDATATDVRKYRWYVGDECGDGHWDGSSFVYGAGLDLSSLFPDDDKGKKTYVRRYRPGSHKLLTLDEQNQPRKAMLHYSQSYTGPYPAVWDGSVPSTWKPITKGWRLLQHRLGIEITIENPEAWLTGEGKDTIRGITWQANPAAGKRFWLMLTTVIDDDFMLDSVVPARIASPTRFQRKRRIDARDHYKYQAVYNPSWFNKTGTDDLVIRDDTEQALSLARQYRTAHEMPSLSGSVTIPYITNYYSLSDQIEMIEGRNVLLRANAASSQGEADRLPTIVKIAWSFQGGRQQTTLHLTDLRAEVQR